MKVNSILFSLYFCSWLFILFYVGWHRLSNPTRVGFEIESKHSHMSGHFVPCNVHTKISGICNPRYFDAISWFCHQRYFDADICVFDSHHTKEFNLQNKSHKIQFAKQISQFLFHVQNLVMNSKYGVTCNQHCTTMPIVQGQMLKSFCCLILFLLSARYTIAFTKLLTIFILLIKVDQ